MSKKVAVIDLGSNSVRMVVFERTSRLGFYTLDEFKIKLRLGEGAYENGGVLQDDAINKGFEAFSEFKKLIDRYKIKKVMAVGTSALRDAPNKRNFISLISKNLGINIRVIDGKSEARYGAIAALNLLPNLSDGVTIDIGGGSTELARISGGKITDTISLNLGTVRLKELFYDKDSLGGMDKFMSEILSQIPSSFKNDNLIAIGGSLRAISSIIMDAKKHPIKIIHAFSYNYKKYKNLITSIANSNINELYKFGVKKDRLDTIREGAFIFKEVANLLGAKNVFTSGVGVREGVFLTSIMPRNPRFPLNFNPSLKSLQDRFNATPSPLATKFARELFEVLSPLHGVDNSHLPSLIIASKLYGIGSKIGYYARHNHSSYIVLNALNYGLMHSQKALIAMIIEMHGKKNISDERYEIFKELLPDKNSICWLSYILEVAITLDRSGDRSVRFAYENDTLHIFGIKEHYFIKESLKKISTPQTFIITFK
ncbi:MAG: Ppx/GppA family phosphatase [Campylobacter sp.]|nr:Ppx/GppA family phosphatase [Campylobacter sp.]